MTKKFTEKDIGSFVDRFYKLYKSDPNQTFQFDFSEYEWISNQNLLLLSSFIKYLYRCNSDFKIKLFKNDLNDVTENEAKTLIQLWEVWKIYKIFDKPNDHFDKYIYGFTNNSIPYLKKRFGINTDKNIYNRLGITPFITLNIIRDYRDENLLETEISPIFDLNEIILSELKDENSEHPFVENTLSAIITRELYENFLDHYQSSFFNTDDDMSFMSISLKRKLGRGKYYFNKTFLLELIKTLSINYTDLIIFLNEEMNGSNSSLTQISIENIKDIIRAESLTKISEITLIEKLEKEDFKNKQYILSKNIREEELTECEGYFKDKYNHFVNDAYIQYSFIDYGRGIPATILEEYLKENKIENIDIFNQPNHNDLLKFAFKHNTSRFPIIDKYGQTDRFIPRGLFDVLTIAQRYRGLIIIRSNYGRIIFNYKNTEDFEQALQPFGTADEFFPGTYITMYIPELPPEIKFDKSVIRCESIISKRKDKPKNINLFSLLGSEFVPKERLYSNLITKLKAELTNDSKLSRLNYISFFGIKDRRVITKAIYFLLTDYEINSRNAVILMHPPDADIISTIKFEIHALNSTIKSFRIHPLPLIYHCLQNDDISVDWIGIYNEEDKIKLNDLLYEDYSLSLSDFIDPPNIKGNLVYTDKYGNINSGMPNRNILIKYYHLYTDNLLKDAVSKYKLLKSNGLYLCNGNYYQNQFLQMSELLDNKIYRDVFATALFQQISFRFIQTEKIDKDQALRYLFDSRNNILPNNKRKLKYIAVTSSSHKIIKSFCEQGFIYTLRANEKLVNAPYINFDNYLDLETDDKIDLIDDETNYIIVCDAISTGNLVSRLDNIICGKNNSQLLYIATFVNNLDRNFENTGDFIEKYSNKLISLHDMPLKKFRALELTDKEYEKNLIRINPFTNLPIEFSENSTFTESILFFNQEKEFLDLIESEDINIRFEIHNNLIHPFYFNIGSILEKENKKFEKNRFSSSIIHNLLIEKKILHFPRGNYVIFYPKGSGIDFLDKKLFNSKIAENHSVQFIELERFADESGWKFPHSSDYFKLVIQNIPNVLIFDDGTCSGDSLYQMVNEISYFEPNRIDLLCIINRIDDYKREFLSKLKSLKKHTNPTENIEVNIYFGSQWHIPTFYPNNNPYSEEIEWLKNILLIINTPQFIRKNAAKILETITPSKEKSQDYKYFPKERLTGEIPKREIILTRNEIGRIAGYRFYTESFEWYNQLTFNKERKDFFDRDFNKQIELLAMCLLYEPYLYSKISKSFPDIRVHLERFVENIFFESNGKKICLDNDLYYDWTNNKKDLIHLFFIVYKDSAFLEFIKRHENILAKFMDFASNNDRALDYILYKFSYYYPVSERNRKGLNLNVKNAIQSTLSKYPSSYNADVNFTEKIKRFNHFTSSLISSDRDDSFENSKSKIENYFNQINNDDYHKTGLNNDKSLINAHFVEIGKRISANEDYGEILILLKERISENVFPYINLILSFSRTYKEFFILEDDYNSLNINDNSLRSLINRINMVIFDNNGRDYDQGRNILSLLFSNYFNSEFFLFQTLKEQITNDVVSLLRNILDTCKIESTGFVLLSNLEEFNLPININMPCRYSKLIFQEIVNNFRHSSDANIKLNIKDKHLNIDILCKKTANKSSGTNFGSILFENLMNNSIFESDNVIKQDDKTYQQKLKFKILV